MPQTDTSLTALRDSLREFAAARDWQQFHTPKKYPVSRARGNARKYNEL